MKYCWCTINVNDVEKSIKFYTELVGLSVESRFSPRPGMEIVFLTDDEGSEIELIKQLQPCEKEDHEGFSMGFEVASLEDAMSLAAMKEVAVIEGPFITPSVKFFMVRDPDGFKIQIVEKTGK